MSWRLHPTKNKHLKPGENRYYQIEVGHGKDRNTIVKQFANDEAAELYDNEMKRAYRPKITSLVAPSFNKMLPDFLEWYRLHRQPSSLEAWLRAWKNLAPHFGKLKPNYLTPSMIDQYKTFRLSQISKVRGTQIKKRTIEKELHNLSAFVSFAVDRNLCNKLTFKIKGFPKNQTAPPPKTIPSPEQIASMLDNMRTPQQRLYKLIYYAGLRSTEARNLKRKDVDLERGIITVQGKGEKIRLVPIANQLKPVLKELMHGKLPDDLLLVSYITGKPYCAHIGNISAAAKKAGITSRITAHTLRHCFGTHCIYWGMDLRTVQLLLGHSTSVTTEMYTTLAATFLTQQMQRFGTSPMEVHQKEELK